VAGEKGFRFARVIFSLVYILKAGQELFRTGWFIESVLSEILITSRSEPKEGPRVKTQQPPHSSFRFHASNDPGNNLLPAWLFLWVRPATPMVPGTNLRDPKYLFPYSWSN